MIKAVWAGAAHPGSAWLLPFFRSGTSSPSVPGPIAGVGAGGDVVPTPCPARAHWLCSREVPSSPGWGPGTASVAGSQAHPSSGHQTSPTSVSCTHGSHSGAAGADSRPCPPAWLLLFPLSSLGKLRHTWLDGHQGQHGRAPCTALQVGGQPGPPHHSWQQQGPEAWHWEGRRAAGLHQGISAVFAASPGLFPA